MDLSQNGSRGSRRLRGTLIVLVVAACTLQFSPDLVEGRPENPSADPPAHQVAITGNGESGFKDGKGADARMNKPIRMAALNATTIVFADINNHAIRTLSIDGVVQTIAGGPDIEGHRDGLSATARLSSPHGVAVRKDGAIAVAEAGGNTIRLLTPVKDGDPSDYIVSTIAGVPGMSGFKDGSASTALFSAPHSVAWGARGELYVADIGNGRLRVIENGQVKTIAGSAETGALDGTLATGTLKYPMDIAVDKNQDLWLVDAGTLLIRRWSPSAGLTTPFKELDLTMPHGIAVDDHALWIADLYKHTIVRVDRSTEKQVTVYGTGTEGAGEQQLRKPAAVLLHAGRLWIADLGNHRIITIPQPSTR